MHLKTGAPKGDAAADGGVAVEVEGACEVGELGGVGLTNC